MISPALAEAELPDSQFHLTEFGGKAGCMVSHRIHVHLRLQVCRSARYYEHIVSAQR